MTPKDEEPDSRVVLTWQKTMICSATPVLIKSNGGGGHAPFIENARPLQKLDARHDTIPKYFPPIPATIFTRCDQKKGEARFLVTCKWRGQTYWSHAPSTKAAKRIAARWLEDWRSFDAYYRIETP